MDEYGFFQNVWKPYVFILKQKYGCQNENQGIYSNFEARTKLGLHGNNSCL